MGSRDVAEFLAPGLEGACLAESQMGSLADGVAGKEARVTAAARMAAD